MVRAQNKKNMYILIAIITLVLIGIGYAFLVGDLNILGNARVNSNNWDVRFENLQVTPGSVEADTPVITNNTTITYTVNLNTTGDYYEFYVDVANRGTIDAMIDSINIDNLNTDQKKYLDYSVAYNSGVDIDTKQELKSGDKETLKVRIAHKKDITVDDLPTENQSLSLTVSIDYKQADNTAVAITHPVCTRATTLHTETCNRTDTGGCIGRGYNQGNTIIYGNIGSTGTLASGDAFDCDVNGDKTYNASTERFYYIGSLDTNSDYGVLVYYNSVSGGNPNNVIGYSYDSSNRPRENGPATAVLQLPTTSKWKNVSLSNTTRKIKSQTSEYIDFSYSGRAARLLTLQELAFVSENVLVTGIFDNSEYLLENTNYSGATARYGYWLENVSEAGETKAIYIDGGFRYLGDYYDANYTNYCVRPVIEVLKSKINY